MGRRVYFRNKKWPGGHSLPLQAVHAIAIFTLRLAGRPTISAGPSAGQLAPASSIYCSTMETDGVELPLLSSITTALVGEIMYRTF